MTTSEEGARAAGSYAGLPSIVTRGVLCWGKGKSQNGGGGKKRQPDLGRLLRMLQMISIKEIRVLGLLGRTCSINTELHSGCRGRTNVPSIPYFATLRFPSIKKNTVLCWFSFHLSLFFQRKLRRKEIYDGRHLIQERY